MQSSLPHNSPDGAAFALHHPSVQFPLPGTRLSVCDLFCGRALNTEDSSGASTRHDTTYIVTGRPVDHVVACMAGIKVQLAVIPFRSPRTQHTGTLASVTCTLTWGNSPFHYLLSCKKQGFFVLVVSG